MPGKRIIKIGNINVKVKNKLSDLDFWQREVQHESEEEVLNLEKLQITDIKNKIENREKLKDFLIKLLVWQNVSVFGIVVFSLLFDKIQSLQLVLSVLIGGTLAETSSMVFYMVRWLFSDIKYQKIK